mgnify:FL=1
MDDGTAYELGYGNALGKPSYGYVWEHSGYSAKVMQNYPWREVGKGQRADRNGYLLLDDFGTSINLMMQCGMAGSGGRLVVGDFEACLLAVRQDLDAEILKLGGLWQKMLGRIPGSKQKDEDEPPLFIPSK